MATRDLPQALATAPLPAERGQGARFDWATEPSWRELLLLACFTFLIFFAVIASVTNFLALVNNAGDSSAYIDVAEAIGKWDFHAVVVKQFWGLPYVIALVSFVGHVSGRSALLLVSIISSLAAVLLAYRLWDGWVASFFALTNFEWLQRSLLGGAEPLFMALLLGGFLAVRRRRWTVAALLFSFATTVRPLGIFALVGLAVVLLYRKRYAALVWSVMIGGIVGALYALPLFLYFGTPLANVQAYQQRDWTGGSLLTLPLIRIVRDLITSRQPWTNRLLISGWILLVSAGVVLGIRNRCWKKLIQLYPVEAIFVALYTLFLFTYNSEWARADFVRFAIPVLPFIFWALEDWLPRDKRLVWVTGILCSLLAAASAIGIRNMAEILRNVI